jgi:hypothetical protein
MASDPVSREEQFESELPAPKPAIDHASFGVEVHERPTPERTEAGILHPAHRAG